jgi:hypothetical protein
LGIRIADIVLEERQNYTDILAAQIKTRISKPGNREDSVTPSALMDAKDGPSRSKITDPTPPS